MIINWSDNYKVSVWGSKPDKYCCIHNFTRLILSGKVSQNILGGCNLRAGSWTNANRGNPLRNWNKSRNQRNPKKMFRNILFCSWQTRKTTDAEPHQKLRRCLFIVGREYSLQISVWIIMGHVFAYLCVSGVRGNMCNISLDPLTKQISILFSHLSPPGPRVNVHYDA